VKAPCKCKESRDILVFVMLQQETVEGVSNSNLKTLFLLLSEVSLHAIERTDDETVKHVWKNKVHRNPAGFSYEDTIEGLSKMKRRVHDPNVLIGQETGYLKFLVVAVIVVRQIGNLTFRGPCIVIYSCNKTNEMHCFSNLCLE
jgi:hypothetical protein